MLDSLAFKDVSERSELSPSNFVEIKPMAFESNSREVMMTLGQLDLAIMGLKCNEIVTQVDFDVDNELQIEDKVYDLLRGH